MLVVALLNATLLLALGFWGGKFVVTCGVFSATGAGETLAVVSLGISLLLAG